MSSVLEKIKSQIDIVDVVSKYIDLTKRGRNFWSLCPFHEDSNPSLSVSPEKQLFKCFVCGKGGDAIKFVSDYEKISFNDALRKLGESVGVHINVKKEMGPSRSEREIKMINVMKDAMEYFQYSLITESGEKALEYAKGRNLSPKVMEDFLIGYAPRSGLKDYLLKKDHDEALLINVGLLNSKKNDFFMDRLIFGITNEFGEVIAFSARDLSGTSKAKYINSPEHKLFSKSNILYNFSSAKEEIKSSRIVFINEGFMDVIAMNRAGIRNSVAIMGTALTKKHISFFKDKTVVLMLDSDKAGVNATIKSIKLLLEAKVKTKVVVNENAKDPDEIIESVGVEGLREVAENQIDALEFIFNLHVKKFPLKSPSSIQKFISSFVKYLTKEDDLTKEFYLSKLSETLGIKKELILSSIPKSASWTAPKNNFQPRKKEQVIKVKDEVKSRNYSYELILSMIKNPKLVYLYRERKQEIIFKDPVILALANYWADVQHGFKGKPSKELKIKYSEIVENNQYVNTSEEFNQLIDRINKEAQKSTQQAFDVKLDNTSDVNEKLKLLEQIRKNKRGKK